MSSPVGPVFSVQHIPFSYAGSWFGISPVIAEETYAEHLHLVSHQTGLHAVLTLVPVRAGAEVETTVSASPSLLTWTDDRGRVELAYETVDTVRLRGHGLGMTIRAAHPTLTPFSGTYCYRDPVDGAHVFTDYGTGRRYRVTVLLGTADGTGVQLLGTGERGISVDDDEPWEVAIEEYDAGRPPYRSNLTFEQVIKAAEGEFTAFLEAVAPWRGPETPAAELAAYVLWSATVRPAGFVTRPAVLMSKHWMDKVWSWDHCFNALALADGLPELAWHQFRVAFDHQDPAGALPDSITHSEVLYNFVKPPIHGWALQQLRRRLRHVDVTELAASYEALGRWTRFWLDTRRAPGEQLPHYQHGNDSGWDNATTFDPERVVQSADLAAFLVLQLRELADLATALGRDDDATRWTATAEEVWAAMLDRLWEGERFAARSPTTGRTWTSESLLDLMAITLGDDLPATMRQALATRIRTHLTAFGPATEQPASPSYVADGYWRGPIWAPSTVLIEDGLRRAGYADLADDISSRFRRLCERSGFAENFDAHTGIGLRDRAYTWTASAYLILAAAHVERSAATAP
ncbi:amylo-alpha-1,6-glucosidase [Micromonospora sp. HK10]|uniref:amylo-alpha-1,6-glucosidase n=1 Tax=Micromonospora sp. HK10 TaxID=1538294 RepID=UPI000626F0F2|nr:trehalase family glycosidase [Micromonospora sp. HK10]KKK04906.1 glycogen debranching protein [Micromonospora sp. HK10]